MNKKDRQKACVYVGKLDSMAIITVRTDGGEVMQTGIGTLHNLMAGERVEGYKTGYQGNAQACSTHV